MILFFPHNLEMTPSQDLNIHMQAVLQIILVHNATNARGYVSNRKALVISPVTK
jgi:hypothetical protein